MADVRWEVYIRQSDGTDFSSVNEAGAAVRLRESTTAGADSGEYTGNVAGSGAFSETGKGLWYIQIDSGDSGWYLVESYTTASGAWADVNGFAPIYITREEFLPLAGGTMSGNIVMGDNSITGVNDITFTDDASGTIGAIISDNLLDKSANETIAGDWACTGFVDITASKLKIAGTVVSMSAAQLNALTDIDTGESDKIAVLQRGFSTNTHATIDANYSVLRADLGGVLPCETDAVSDTTLTLPTLSTSANAGAMVLVRFVTDGGKDLVVQTSGGSLINAAGLTGSKLTFEDAGDWCLLVSSGFIACEWGVIINKGGSGLS